MKLEGSRALVIGMEKSGRAAFEFLRARGAIVTATDLNSHDVANFRPQTDALLDEEWDLMVPSPGVPLDLPAIERATGDVQMLLTKPGARRGQFVPVFKATAGWDDKRGVTEVQRRKEEASDYRYFPEPDLVPILVDAVTVEQVRAGLGELPAAQNARLQQQYGLSSYDAG